MAYSDQSQFPKGKVPLSGITNVAQTVFNAFGGAQPAGRIKLCHIAIANADTVSNTLILRAVGAGAEIARITLPTGKTLDLPGWEVNTLGLEVITTAPFTNTGWNVTAFYLL